MMMVSRTEPRVAWEPDVAKASGSSVVRLAYSLSSWIRMSREMLALSEYLASIISFLNRSRMRLIFS